MRDPALPAGYFAVVNVAVLWCAAPVADAPGLRQVPDPAIDPKVHVRKPSTQSIHPGIVDRRNAAVLSCAEESVQDTLSGVQIESVAHGQEPLDVGCDKIEIVIVVHPDPALDRDWLGQQRRRGRRRRNVPLHAFQHQCRHVDFFHQDGPEFPLPADPVRRTVNVEVDLVVTVDQLDDPGGISAEFRAVAADLADLAIGQISVRFENVVEVFRVGNRLVDDHVGPQDEFGRENRKELSEFPLAVIQHGSDVEFLLVRLCVGFVVCGCETFVGFVCVHLLAGTTSLFVGYFGNNRRVVSVFLFVVVVVVVRVRVRVRVPISRGRHKARLGKSRGIPPAFHTKGPCRVLEFQLHDTDASTTEVLFKGFHRLLLAGPDKGPLAGGRIGVLLAGNPLAPVVGTGSQNGIHWHERRRWW
mmetsp:Transcript_4473/g.12916  ORF Transcript_4473/g.12916 Transcript_4473/m.12916 type:complete len:414 (-) Transcript_4473:940-2181(-)